MSRFYVVESRTRGAIWASWHRENEYVEKAEAMAWLHEFRHRNKPKRAFRIVCVDTDQETVEVVR